MIQIILIAVVAVIVLFLIVVAMRPPEFRITRSAVIAAPIATVFNQVNDLHKWQEWSPWAKLDPNAKKSFDGPLAGVGAKFGWSGNNKIGEGSMTITDSRPSEFIRFNLEFLRPMKCNNIAEFAFKPEGKGTSVNWAMTGRNSFISKAFCLVMNMDKMIGSDFEKGLAQLKALSESAAKK